MGTLNDLIGESLGNPVDVKRAESVGGGCIHNAQRIETDTEVFFLKQSSHDRRELLQSEVQALQEIAKTKTVRVPEVVANGETEEGYALVLEWIDLRRLSSSAGEKLGSALAALHQSEGAEQYGWQIDNFIGSTPQQNTPTDSWPSFYRDHRLAPQIQLAERNGYDLPAANQLLDNIECFFPANNYPMPSPLHGDLWGGNAAEDGSGNPVLFDPAFYYGDPETDIAFSRYFGGFPESFYRQYEEATPSRPGWKNRQILYNLYHVLNHLNIFGPGYLAEAGRMIEDLSEVATRKEYLS